MKRAILGILAVASLVFALAPFSPYGVTNTLTRFNQLKEARESYNRSESEYCTAQQSYAASKNTFDGDRTFEVYYGDIVRLKQLFDGVLAVNVLSVTSCDASNYFSTVAEWSPTDTIVPTAVKFSLTTEDLNTALNVIDKMELPIYQLLVTEPNLIDVTFLTGEDIS